MLNCPNCGRSFRTTNQDHSCQITDLESRFVNKQQNVIDTFTLIKDVVMKLEGVEVISVKNAILFQAKSNFLAAKPRKAHLDIEFLLNEKVEGFPVYKTFMQPNIKLLTLLGWNHRRK